MIRRTKKKARARWRGGVETLEARLLLAAEAPFLELADDPRKVPVNDIFIQFDAPVSGFEIDDLIFTHAGPEGVREIVLPGSGAPGSRAELNTADNRNFRLTKLASLTAAEGDYHLILDVDNAGISPLSVDDFGLSLGPELILNGEFDEDVKLAGWLVSSVDGVRWKDGVARITSLHTVTPDEPDFPEGSEDANIQQEIVVSPHTTYRIEFDLVSTQLGAGTRVDLRILDGGANGPVMFEQRFFGDAHRDLKFVTGANSTVAIQFMAVKDNRDFTVDNVTLRRPVLGPSVDWTMDTTAPTASILAVDPNPRNKEVTDFTIAFSEPITGLDESDFALTRNGAGVPLSGAQAITSDGGISSSLSGLDSETGPDGNYVLTLNAVGTGIQDSAGNSLAGNVSESWTMDTVAPTPSVVQQLDVEDRSPGLTGGAGESNATVEVTVNGVTYGRDDGVIVDGTIWTLPAGTIDPPLADGPYNIEVKATDAAGNFDTDSTTNELVIDAAPVVTVVEIRTADRTPKVTGTIDDPNGTIPEITINNVTYHDAVIVTGNTWELPDDVIAVPLLEGPYDVTVKSIDASNPSNSTTITAVGALQIDLKPIVINEILFRPSSPRVEPTTAGNAEPTDEEYIELYNNSEVDIPIGGWQFTSGISYTIPQGTTIPARGYLVVAADVAAFTAKYPTAPAPVGGWIRTLSNSGENIRLETAGGDLVDRVRYADSGDWAVRRWEQDWNGSAGVWGWVWFAPHDDDGHSLELMNPDLTNREGQNWAPSASPLGTPGAANSVASGDIPPMLVDVTHSPAIPTTNEPVVVSARIVNEADSGVDVSLFYRLDPAAPTTNTQTSYISTTPFIELPMLDDGSGGDAVAGDGVFSATVPGQATNRTIVDFYVEARENTNNVPKVRSYPAPSDDSSGHDANLLYQVDDTVLDDFVNDATRDWPVEQPIYRIVMPASQLRGLHNNGPGGDRSDEEYHATIIVRDPARGIDIDNGDLAAFNLDVETVSILFRENLLVGGENIDAVHVLDNGNLILSTVGDARLGSNALVFRDGDLVQYDPVDDTATLIFSEDAFGSNQDIDAIWVKEDGQGRITELILSTDDTFTVGGVNFLNADLVKIVVPSGVDLKSMPLSSLSGPSVARVFSESLFSGGANIDAVHRLDNGHFLLSTAKGERLAGLQFGNGAVIEFDPGDSDPGAGVPGNSVATIFFDESNFADGNEDINALYVDLGRDLLVLSTDGDNAGLGTDTEIIYGASVRVRGNSSRSFSPRNLRVSLPSDQPLGGQSVLVLNMKDPHDQLLSHTVFQEAGLAAQAPAKAVQVRLNSLNGGGVGGQTRGRTFGAYVQLQIRNGDLAEANFPLDSGGNLYALGAPDGGNSATFTQNPDTFDYKDRTGYPPGTPEPIRDTGYTKQTNDSVDDWSDLPELARVFIDNLTPDSDGGDDLNFVHKVSQVINVSQWLRHMAVGGLIRNNEHGYTSGNGQEYALYRGELDTRFELVPHDLDETFSGSNEQVISEITPGSAFRGLGRVLDNVAFRAIFAGHLIDLMDTVFNSQHLDPIIDELFGVGGADYVPTAQITDFKNFVSGRVNYIRNTVLANDTENYGTPVSPNDLSQLPAEFQSLALQQKYLRISEIMFNPQGEELEFVELINMGNTTLDLTGVHFKGGILFGFNDGAPIDSPIPRTPFTDLGPGERVLVVENRAAFLAHHDPNGTDVELQGRIAGEFWNGGLSNRGERILLEGRLGEPILDFSYDDNWYDQTDGEGFSLVLRDGINKDTPRSAWGEKSTWRASGFTGGSPGTDVVDPADGRIEYEPDSIRINELLSHTDLAPNGDWVELHNTSNAPIDIGGWYLSDAGNNLRKFRIPDDPTGLVIPGGTVIPAGGFVVIDQFGPGGFGNNSAFDDDGMVTNPFGDPGAFGLSELGDKLQLSSVDPDDIRANIDAAHVMPSGNILLSTTGTEMLGESAFSFRNGDLVEYDLDSGMVTLKFSELSFIGVAENIDAVSMFDGDFVLSTGGPALLPAAAGTPGTVVQMLVDGVMTDVLSFGNGDLVSWDPISKTATLVFSESLFDPKSSGLPPNENIDALHVLGNNEFIISTSGAASIGRQLFDDGDLIRVVTSAGGTALVSASLYFSENLFAIETPNLVPTENIDAVFVDEARGPNGTVMLSAASSFSLSNSPLVVFDDGDLVEIRLGSGANLTSLQSNFGIGASASRLLAEDPADGSITFYGEAAGYRETVNFGAAQREVTFGMYEKSPSSSDSTDFTSQVFTTRGSANAAPRIGPVVINEIMYNPPGDAAPGDGVDDVEFIELFNLTNSPVVLTNWTISSAFDFTFPLGKTIPANGYLLLVSDLAEFENPNNVPAAQIVEYSGRLDNGGETIRLNKPGEQEPNGLFPAILVDRVKYDDELPWPAGVDGADGTGRSLSRFISTDYGNDVANWLPSGTLQNVEPSPGRVNTTFDISPPEAPTNLRHVAITNSRIDVSWDVAFEPHSGIDFYTVFRKIDEAGEVFEEIDQTSNTTSDDRDIAGSTRYVYRLSATNTSGKESALSIPFTVAILRLDSTIVPTVTQLMVELSEALDESSAEIKENYRITGPNFLPSVTVDLARLDGDGRTVILTTSSMEEGQDYQLTVENVVAVSGNTLAQTPQTIVVEVPDLTAPRVTGVEIASSDWSQEFFDHLDAAGLLGTDGFSIPGGVQQLSTIGWSNVNQIIIQFDEHVEIQSDDLSILGVNTPSFAVSDFAYVEVDDVQFMATWTLQGNVQVDKLLLELSERVQDRRGNPVDGNWVDGQSSFPSGNGVIESNDIFALRLNVLPGDSDGGGVGRSDLINTISHLGTQTGQPGYDPLVDIDGSGRVDVNDLRQVVYRLSTSLPTGTPGGGGQAPVVAVDALFNRLGGGSPEAALADTPLPLTASDPAGLILRARTSPAIARRAGRTAARRAAVRAVDLALADGDDLGDDDGSLLSVRGAIGHSRRTLRRR